MSGAADRAQALLMLDRVMPPNTSRHFLYFPSRLTRGLCAYVPTRLFAMPIHYTRISHLGDFVYSAGTGTLGGHSKIILHRAGTGTIQAEFYMYVVQVPAIVPVEPTGSSYRHY